MDQCTSEEYNKKQKLNCIIKTFKQVKEKINIKLSKKEDKLSEFNIRNIHKRLKRVKEANENIKKETKHIEIQQLEVQKNLVEVQDQF